MFKFVMSRPELRYRRIQFTPSTTDGLGAIPLEPRHLAVAVFVLTSQFGRP